MQKMDSARACVARLVSVPALVIAAGKAVAGSTALHAAVAHVVIAHPAAATVAVLAGGGAYAIAKVVWWVTPA